MKPHPALALWLFSTFALALACGPEIPPGARECKYDIDCSEYGPVYCEGGGGAFSRGYCVDPRGQNCGCPATHVCLEPRGRTYCSPGWAAWFTQPLDGDPVGVTVDVRVTARRLPFPNDGGAVASFDTLLLHVTDTSMGGSPTSAVQVLHPDGGADAYRDSDQIEYLGSFSVPRSGTYLLTLGQPGQLSQQRGPTSVTVDAGVP